MKLKLLNVRTAFLNVHKPSAIGDGEPRYSAVFIIEPGSEQAKQLAAAVASVAREQWKEKAASVIELLSSGDKICYRRGPKKNSSGEIYEGFEGMHYLSASNKAKPKIKDGDGKTDLAENSGRPYSGCMAHAVIEIWAQDNKWGKRVNCTLQGIMFAGDNDAFGGGVAASDSDFDDMPVTESAGTDADPLADLM